MNRIHWCEETNGSGIVADSEAKPSIRHFRPFFEQFFRKFFAATPNIGVSDLPVLKRELAEF